ncbi:Phosphoglycerate mutase-like protein [Glarea lozoyensis ATCC 20868]|uniref:Phosphoglycerate mutase-like protein n=1 Tax=Glarea lozoyensis (strain ATCC 20868 / MF5171) TaxID=1116229 RepID=S3E9G0_GLAL2|nr:Phosphoglycerate mutase-like protein [Glarea lozoyensis ATCC 20868]EPE34938.1 Phosphoglycerate mutase-like protein [Glarea lozoyensis ATCC 20868]
MRSWTFKVLTLSALSALALGHWTPRPNPSADYVNYTTVTGFFLQDEASTVPGTFDYTTANFGLINRTYPTDNECSRSFTQWQKFEHYVDTLNQRSGRNVDYKVLFMGRHGEGYHNVAESYYGTPAWNCYWSLLDGNGTSVWADAKITPKGQAQAETAAKYWASRVALQKIPIPQSLYTSPLTRCLQTAEITFSGLYPRHQRVVPTVKEYFREGISGHTCDRRSTKSYIRKTFPTFEIEKGFSEQDLLFKPHFAEQPVDQDIRTKAVLDDVFGNDSNTWLSITSHSGETASLLRVLKHRVFSLSTGSVIPVLVKAETIKGTAPVTSTVAWSSISTCSTAPPLPTPTA